MAGSSSGTAMDPNDRKGPASTTDAAATIAAPITGRTSDAVGASTLLIYAGVLVSKPPMIKASLLSNGLTNLRANRKDSLHV